MKLPDASLLFLLPFLLASAAGRVSSGTPQDNDHAVPIIEEHMLRQEPRLLQDMLCTQCKTIYVAFHLLEDVAGTSNTATLWSDAQIAIEIDNLNNQWSNTPFKFELLEGGIDRQQDDFRNTMDQFNREQLDIIAADSRMGGRTTVNVFVNDGAVCGPSGLATDDSANPNMFPVGEFSTLDRVSICGNAPFPMHSFIMSHEIGHWLGLKHTFQGNSCSGDGDGIDDTPQQSAATVGCPDEIQESCGSPILLDNFMDYSTCPDKKFTQGQRDRMYSGFIISREQSVPCADDEAQIDFEIEFDENADDENSIIITKWGVSPGPQNFGIMDKSKTSYSNKMAKHTICLPRNTMYQIELNDSGQNGLQTGYFAYSLNGEEVYRGTSWSGRSVDSVLLAGDTVDCKDGQGRFKLELEFDGRPNDILWEIKNAAGTLIVDQSSTTFAGRDTYILNFVGSTLIFDQCLDFEEHTFTITDTNGDGLQTGFFAIYLDGELENMSPAGSFTTSDVVTFTVKDPNASTGGFCFSSSRSVQVLDKGRMKLEDLKIGDRVHVGNGIFEPVYSFGHFNLEARSQFLEIKTDKTTLQLTYDHMVFGASGVAHPASMVQVGDQLVDGNGETVLVQSLKTVSSTGVAAPFTPSGKIVVDDILASSFVSFGSSAYLSVWGVNFSYQWLSHSFEFPHRLACNYSECLEETYDVDGVSNWAATPHHMARWLMDDQRSELARDLLGTLIVATLFMFNILEFIVLYPVSFGLGAFTIGKIAQRRRDAKRA